MLITAALRGNLGDGPVPWWVLILFIPILFTYILIWGPINMGRQVEKNERLTSKTVWEVDESQILIKNQFSEVKMDWGSFQKVIETPDYYLLIHTANKRMFHFVPKRAFESEVQETAFRDILSRKFQKID